MIDPIDLQHDVVFKRWTPTIVGGNPTYDEHGNPVATYPSDAQPTKGFMQADNKSEFRDGVEYVVAQWMGFFNSIGGATERDRATWAGKLLKIIAVMPEQDVGVLHHYEVAFIEIEGEPA